MWLFNIFDESLILPMGSFVLVNEFIFTDAQGLISYGHLLPRDIYGLNLLEVKREPNYSFIDGQKGDFYESVILLHPAVRKEDLIDYIKKCFDTVIKPDLEKISVRKQKMGSWNDHEMFERVSTKSIEKLKRDMEIVKASRRGDEMIKMKNDFNLSDYRINTILSRRKQYTKIQEKEFYKKKLKTKEKKK